MYLCKQDILFISLIFASGLVFSQVNPTFVGAGLVVILATMLAAHLYWSNRLVVKMRRLAIYTFFPLVAILVCHVALFNFSEPSVALLPFYSSFVVVVVMFVVPYVISPERAYGYVARLGVAIGLLGLPAAILGHIDYGFFVISSDVGGTRSFQNTLPPAAIEPLLSIYRNPNVTGQLFFVAVIASVGEWFRSRTHLSLCLTLFNSVFLYLTQSRGAMAATLVSLVIIITHKQISQRIRLLSILGLLTSVSAFIVVAITAPIITNFPIDLTGRVEIWRGTFQIVWQTNPLFGVGLVGESAFKQVSVSTATAHSMYLQILLQAGVIGVILFIALFWGALLDGVARGISDIPIALGAGFVVRGVFEAIKLFGVGTGPILLALTIGYLLKGGPQYTVQFNNR